MKKRIIICAFLLLILFTAVYTVVTAVNTYHYEVKHDDILVGLGAGITILVGGFAVVYELDLFYTVYYFFIKPKTKAKTVLNIFANLSLMIPFVFIFLSDTYMGLRKYEFVPVIFIIVYIMIRIFYLIVSGRSIKNANNK
ncbi:MAG: hypothetical protein IKI50_04780 [Clostridia bacterium]|nr:hypothetical protein [Clostridia bacterium]